MADLTVKPPSLVTHKLNNAKHCEYRDGRVKIGAQLIAAGEGPAHYDPEGFGKHWRDAIRKEAEAKGLCFVPSVNKEKLIAASEATSPRRCATLVLGSSNKAVDIPFKGCYAMRVTVTNDICDDEAKARSDPNGIVGTAPMVVLVQPGMDSFWAQVMVSNCYPRAHEPDACLRTEVPKLKDVRFHLSGEVPHFANLVDAADYERCVDMLKKDYKGRADALRGTARADKADKEADDYSFRVVEGCTYMGGTQFELKGLAKRPELNGRLVRVASAQEWKKNAAAHPGRVQVVLKEGGETIFVKPANMCKPASSVPPPVPKTVPKPVPKPVQPTQDAKEKARSEGLEKIRATIAATSDKVFACMRCGAHRPLGYKCCGYYVGTMGEQPVQRRNVREHPDADEDEVDAFLEAQLNIDTAARVLDHFKSGFEAALK